MNHSFIPALALALLAAGCSQTTGVSSPDGTVRVNVVRTDSAMTYDVTVDGHQLIAPSTLGLVAEGLTPAPDAKITYATAKADTVWHQPWGENKEIRSHYNELAMTLTDPSLTMTVRVRAFDDGVALRYEWSATGRDSIVVMDELTGFRFADDATTWSIPADFDSYEKEYRELPLDSVTDANTPFTFLTGGSGVYGSIHEAALYDYPEMTLRRDDTSARTLRAALAPMPDGVKAVTPATFVTPWRTIQIGRKATDLINSAMILNLNEPCRIDDTSWIRPQKYVGIWWGMHLGTQTWTMGPRHGATTENAIRYIDFAADNNLQGVLFEGWNEGWENWGGNQHFDYIKAYADFDIDSIARYATSRGIELYPQRDRRKHP